MVHHQLNAGSFVFKSFFELNLKSVRVWSMSDRWSFGKLCTKCALYFANNFPNKLDFLILYEQNEKIKKLFTLFTWVSLGVWIQKWFSQLLVDKKNMSWQCLWDLKGSIKNFLKNISKRDGQQKKVSSEGKGKKIDFYIFCFSILLK